MQIGLNFSTMVIFSSFYCLTNQGGKFPTGTYAGFDETEPTSQQDGKAKVVAYLKNRYQYRYVTMIGDGVTDMEACPPAVSANPNPRVKNSH